MPAAQGLQIDYRAGDVQQLAGQFDLVTSMEVIEHVAEPGAFLKALAARLAPGGLLVMSTPNATGWSKLLMITVGEGLGPDPQGHARFRQVHRAGANEVAARGRRPSMRAMSRASPSRRRAGCTSATISGSIIWWRRCAPRNRPCRNGRRDDHFHALAEQGAEARAATSSPRTSPWSACARASRARRDNRSRSDAPRR